MKPYNETAHGERKMVRVEVYPSSVRDDLSSKDKLRFILEDECLILRFNSADYVQLDEGQLVESITAAVSGEMPDVSVLSLVTSAHTPNEPPVVVKRYDVPITRLSDVHPTCDRVIHLDMDHNESDEDLDDDEYGEDDEEESDDYDDDYYTEYEKEERLDRIREEAIKAFMNDRISDRQLKAVLRSIDGAGAGLDADLRDLLEELGVLNDDDYESDDDFDDDYDGEIDEEDDDQDEEPRRGAFSGYGYFDDDEDDEEEETEFASKIFISAGGAKKDVKRHGIIVVSKSSKYHRRRDHDKEIIMRFLRGFLPGNSDWIREYRKDVAERWMSQYYITKKRAKKIQASQQSKPQRKRQSKGGQRMVLSARYDPFYDANK